MYKSKLQELCQRRSWDLPEYTTVKDGPDHMPRFTASVNVKGQVFETPASCKSAKEAQNTAARIAFEHFYVPPRPRPVRGSAPVGVDHPAHAVPMVARLHAVPPVAPAPETKPVSAVPRVLPVSPSPSSVPMPTPGLLPAKNDANIKPTDGEVPQPNYEDTTQASMLYRASISSHDESYKETLHMYKNRLQQYAQKKNLEFPVYTSEAEGPPHARRFKSKVCVGGKSFETFEFFSTLKEAEQAAAKVACQFLSVDAIQEDGGLYKNLLQEYAQKKGLLCPSYETVSFGLSHRPLFVSTVEIGSHSFKGDEAKTKKQAEMNAAKVAYCAFTEKSSGVSLIEGYSDDVNLRENLQSAPIDKHEDVILPTPESKQHEDVILANSVTKMHENATDEGAQTQAKRPKGSPEEEGVDVHPPGLSKTNSTSDDLSSPASGQEQPKARPSPHRRTVVFPRKSNLPIPAGASVMPYSDEQWVAYKVEPHQEPAS